MKVINKNDLRYRVLNGTPCALSVEVFEVIDSKPNNGYIKVKSLLDNNVKLLKEECAITIY